MQLNLLNTTTKKWIAMFYAIYIYFNKINTNVGTVVYCFFFLNFSEFWFNLIYKYFIRLKVQKVLEQKFRQQSGQMEHLCLYCKNFKGTDGWNIKFWWMNIEFKFFLFLTIYFYIFIIIFHNLHSHSVICTSLL